MTKFLLSGLKNKSKGMLYYTKLYLLIFFFIFSFNSRVLAQDSFQYESSSAEEFEEFSKTEKVSFFYLLGTAGYNNDTFTKAETYGQTLNADAEYDGFAIEFIGGWQKNRYFAMDLALRYRQSEFNPVSTLKYELMNFDLKYTFLFQPYFELNSSWSIMPKIGVGVSLITVSDWLGYEINQQILDSGYGFGFGIHGTIGARAIYKKFIFGISYELGGSWVSYSKIDTDLSLTSHRVMFEAGVKF